ncbi:MAG: peptide-methionine (S)-S-oxide reductase MsrA [Steroidobacteraceae bacterium]|jgi:peptide-methionine (S)-S-oxide reductase
MFRLRPSRVELSLVHIVLALSVALGLQARALAADPSGSGSAHASERPASVTAGISDKPTWPGSLQTAVLAGGCFWGTQGVFEHVKGVRQVLAGYSGGEKATADYETVSTGTTGHAESIQVTFDPAVVSYADILQVFFSVAHDPTELNRQGPDTGTQYRSEIFFADDSQQKIALAYIAQLEQAHIFGHRIVTRVDPLKGFYPAEAYHQDFLVRNPRYPYIVYNDLPKIANLKRELPQMYIDEPVLVAAAR